MNGPLWARPCGRDHCRARLRRGGIASGSCRLVDGRPKQAHGMRRGPQIRVSAGPRLCSTADCRRCRERRSRTRVREAGRRQFAATGGGRAGRQRRLCHGGIRRAHRRTWHWTCRNGLRRTGDTGGCGCARRSQSHACGRRLGVRTVLLQLTQLGQRQRGAALIGYQPFTRCERHRWWWWRISGDDWTLECLGGIRGRLGMGIRTETGDTRRHMRNRPDRSLAKSARLDRQHRRSDRPRTCKHTARHHRHRLRRGLVRIVDALRGSWRIVVRVVVVDCRIVDGCVVDHTDVGHIDVVEVVARNLIGRPVHVVGSERKPAHWLVVADVERDT